MGVFNVYCSWGHIIILSSFTDLLWSIVIFVVNFFFQLVHTYCYEYFWCHLKIFHSFLSHKPTWAGCASGDIKIEHWDLIIWQSLWPKMAAEKTQSEVPWRGQIIQLNPITASLAQNNCGYNNNVIYIYRCHMLYGSVCALNVSPTLCPIFISVWMLYKSLEAN